MNKQINSSNNWKHIHLPYLWANSVLSSNGSVANISLIIKQTAGMQEEN